MRITSINTIKTNHPFGSKNSGARNNANRDFKIVVPSDTDITGLYKTSWFPRINIRDFSRTEVEQKYRTYDSFTGLRDKNYLLSTLDIEIENAKRERKPLSVAMFDMDNFKSVNELLGYETGDKFIKAISKDILETAKENNLDVYRFGGEEFFIIFENQTDSEKEQIAQAIAKKTNENPIMQSYKEVYIKNAKSRLFSLLHSMAMARKISELKTKRETIKEVIRNLNSEEARNDPWFEKAINETNSQIRDIYNNLINELLLKEQDIKYRSMLIEAQSKLISGRGLTKSDEIALLEYMLPVYDKSNEIYQTKKWINDFEQNGGFGITCGVINIDSPALDNKTPMYVIEKAGDILKKGKNIKKGRVYFENIK